MSNSTLQLEIHFLKSRPQALSAPRAHMSKAFRSFETSIPNQFFIVFSMNHCLNGWEKNECFQNAFSVRSQSVIVPYFDLPYLEYRTLVAAGSYVKRYSKVSSITPIWSFLISRCPPHGLPQSTGVLFESCHCIMSPNSLYRVRQNYFDTVFSL